MTLGLPSLQEQDSGLPAFEEIEPLADDGPLPAFDDIEPLQDSPTVPAQRVSPITSADMERRLVDRPKLILDLHQRTGLDIGEISRVFHALDNEPDDFGVRDGGHENIAQRIIDTSKLHRIPVGEAIEVQRQEIVAGKPRSAFESAKQWVRQRTGYFEPPAYGREPTRAERPLRTLAGAGLYYGAEFVSGLGLNVPDILTHRVKGRDSLAEAVNQTTGFRPSPDDIQAGELLDFMGGLKTMGGISKVLVNRIAARQAMKRILRSGVTFAGRELTEEVSKKIINGDPISMKEVWTQGGVGVCFGVAEVALAKGLEKWTAHRLAKEYARRIPGLNDIPMADRVKTAQAAIDSHKVTTGEMTMDQWHNKWNDHLYKFSEQLKNLAAKEVVKPALPGYAPAPPTVTESGLQWVGELRERLANGESLTWQELDFLKEVGVVPEKELENALARTAAEEAKSIESTREALKATEAPGGQTAPVVRTRRAFLAWHQEHGDKSLTLTDPEDRDMAILEYLADQDPEFATLEDRIMELEESGNQAEANKLLEQTDAIRAEIDRVVTGKVKPVPELADEARNKRRNRIQNALSRGEQVSADDLREFAGEAWLDRLSAEQIVKPPAAAPEWTPGETPVEPAEERRISPIMPEHELTAANHVVIPSDIGDILVPQDKLTGEYGPDLEKVFNYGNFQGDIDQPDLRRSLSVGDTIEYRGHTFMVMREGWRDITGLSDDAIKALQTSENAVGPDAIWRQGEAQRRQQKAGEGAEIEQRPRPSQELEYYAEHAFRKGLQAGSVFEGGEVEPSDWAWRAMGPVELGKILSGGKFGGGRARRGNWWSWFPSRSAAEQGKPNKPKYLVEIKGARIEGEGLANRRSLRNVTGIWKSTGKGWERLTIEQARADLAGLPKPGAKEGPAVKVNVPYAMRHNFEHFWSGLQDLEGLPPLVQEWGRRIFGVAGKEPIESSGRGFSTTMTPEMHRALTEWATNELNEAGGPEEVNSATRRAQAILDWLAQSKPGQVTPSKVPVEPIQEPSRLTDSGKALVFKSPRPGIAQVRATIKIVPGAQGTGAFLPEIDTRTETLMGGGIDVGRFHPTLEQAQAELRDMLEAAGLPHIEAGKVGPTLMYSGSWAPGAMEQQPGYSPQRRAESAKFVEDIEATLEEVQSQFAEERKDRPAFGESEPQYGQWLTAEDADKLPAMIAKHGDFWLVLKWSQRERQIIKASDFVKHHEQIVADAEVKTGDYLREVFVRENPFEGITPKPKPPAEPPYLKQWQHFRAKYPDTILFMRIGDSYETFNEQAELAAELLDLSKTHRQGLTVAGVPFHALDDYLKRLLKAGYRVAVVEQAAKPDAVRVETPAEQEKIAPEPPTDIVSLPVEGIRVDPRRFQFKLKATGPAGVTEKLESVEQWSPKAAGTVLVWQDAEGNYYVVDGHHRLALAKRLGVEGINAYVVREIEGISDKEAMVLGAMSNLADEKGTAIDAAKLFRESDISLADLKAQGVDVRSEIVKQGLAMKALSDEVFRMVVDERIPANMAAKIGEHVTDPTQQRQVAEIIEKGDVQTVREAELLAKTIDAAPVLSKTTQTLFGAETTEKSLYAERAKLLSNVEKVLKENKKVFGVLSRKAGIIESKGNILAREANIEAKTRADEILYLLEKLVNAKGPVADALNNATIRYAEHPTKDRLAEVSRELLDEWESRLTVESVGGVREELPEQDRPPVEGEGPLFGPGEREAGFLNVEPLEDVATELGAIARKASGSPAEVINSTWRLLKRNIPAATTYFRTLGGPGIKIANDLGDITFEVTRHANRDMADIRRDVYKGFRAEDRIKVAKILNERLPREGQSADMLKRVDAFLEVLDRSKDEANALGMTRLVHGKPMPIKGTGKAFPQVPNEEGRKFLKEARTQGKASKRVFAWAQEQVKAGRFENVDDAVTALQRLREDSLRGLNPYLERTRVELPDEMLEWDGTKFLESLLNRNWMTVEGVRKWGFKDEYGRSFPLVNSRIEQIHQTFGPDHAQRVKQFIRVSFGAPSPASKEAQYISNKVRAFQFITKVGTSPLGILRNMFDRIAKGAMISPLGTIEAAIQYPPFINGLIESAQRLEDEMIRRGAVFGHSALSEGYEAGSAIEELLRSPFTESERGNQVFIATVAHKRLMRDLAILEKERPGTLGAVEDRIMRIFGGSREQAAVRVGPDLLKKIEKGEPITDDDVSRFLHDTVSRFAFPMLLDTKPVWWDSHPMLKILAQFKTWPMRQLNMVWEDVLKYSVKTGDYSRLLGFLVGTLLAGELYNVARDLLLGRERSIVSQFRRPADARHYGRAILRDLFDGGVVGVIADFTYGLYDWTKGVTFKTGKNVWRTSKQIRTSPSLAPQAIEQFIEKEVTSYRQIKSLITRLDPDSDSIASQYYHWRAQSYEWQQKRKAPGLIGEVAAYADDAIWGRPDYDIGENTLALELASRQVVVGDIEDAADYLAYVLKRSEDKGKTLAGIKVSRTRRSPLGMIPEADRPKFLSALPQEARVQAIAAQRAYLRSYEKALLQAVREVKRK